MLSTHEAQQLGAAFEIAWPQAAEDAATLDRWTEPWDDLVAYWRVRHGWTAGYAVAYLTALREFALPLEDLDP
jgi:hypothetical protein